MPENGAWPVRETVVQTSMVALHAIEDTGGRALVFWILPSIWATCVVRAEDLFEIMEEGTHG